MKARPILFSASMVKALLAGRKTQTRRVVKPTPGLQSKWLTAEHIDSVPHGEMIAGGWQMHHPRAGDMFAGVRVEHDSPYGWIRCPYGQHGDLLWVRESGLERPERTPRMMRAGADTWERYYYDADGYANNTDREQFKEWGFKRRPSIHMPRWASRLTLRITDVRVERLNEISPDDCIAEGAWPIEQRELGRGHEAVSAYQALWERINGPGSWDANPWVWVVAFDVLHKNVEAVLAEAA